MSQRMQTGGSLTPMAGSHVVAVAPGGSFDLRVAPLEKRVGDAVLPMLAYNGSIPGPTLRVQQGSEIFVNVTNATEMETTVHWHGLRLENSYDGVPAHTQAPIRPGASYTHRLTFPDPGLYWYHPHMREDYAQELGLYGNVLVEPTDEQYWPPADHAVVLTLDDLLLEQGKIAAFGTDGANYAAMGRFGNVLLIGGETAQQLQVPQGAVARFYLTNTANTRVFRITIPDVRMKLIGGDSGRYEQESWVDDVVIAPSERAILDVRFDQAGRFELQHVTPDRTSLLAEIDVPGSEAATVAGEAFATLRVNDDMRRQHQRADGYLAATPDKTLALVAVMDVAEPEGEAVVYACPMHPEVVADQPGTCPLCGMKLLPRSATAEAPEPAHDHHHDMAGMADGIEWEDLMPEVNRDSTSANMHWKVVDRATGAENDAISWSFQAGEQVKIRLVNEMESDHPMHHPFHVHGQRFLVLARNEEPEANLVWKDTVLIRTGETVDILLDASNPGQWMAHCHIAEHLESGMMFTFQVRPATS